ncbi:DUF3231 family protein [Ectobacillus ponti]|uniref:DUF3231 family protein n=1 Tax=Ectobacillus ponti TaxID=2961894 RepID=A0AA41X2M0_9BACI|nr:DUF3231 family protein [Ectobacillus ponti]MCP8967799.1 DUF3231 family protein [Ectobacillus ponti]
MKHTAGLTAAELGIIWNLYIANTMGVCLYRHFLKHAEDPDVHACLRDALKLSTDNVKQVTELYHREQLAPPLGFGDEDVRLDAPRLFSDAYCLQQLDMMLKLGSIYYTISLPGTSRLDVRELVTGMIFSTIQLSNRVIEVLLEKGMYVRPPYIPMPQGVEFVQKQSFFNGFFGDKRPLLGIEVGQIFSNVYFNVTKSVMLMGFSQVAEDRKLREYFLRGKEINKKQITVMNSFLVKEDLPPIVPQDYVVTQSTTPPYSDRLMLFLVTNLSSAKIRNFGDSIAVSPRHDLGACYGRLIVETGNFAEDGGNMLIERGWMERPPHTPDRNRLSKEGTP